MSSRFATTLLLVNPASGGGGTATRELVSQLAADGPIHIRSTEDFGSTQDWIRAHAGARARVIVGGGDGTLNSVVGAILDAGATLAVLPLGTANDFARSLGVPADLDEAMSVALAGTVRYVDVGLMNERCFLNAVGIGLGPAMTKELSNEKKQRFGVFAYPLTLLGVIKQRHAFRAIVQIDGRRRRLRALQITIANGIHYGGGMTVSVDASMDDGQLRLLSVQPQSIWSLLSHLIALRWGSIRGRTHLKLYAGRTIEIHTSTPMDVTRRR